MAYLIRSFSESDADALSKLTLAAIRSVGSYRYSEEQVEAWAERAPDAAQFIARARRGSHIFVATDEANGPVAYVTLERGGHLDMLYCHPDHTRHKLADELLVAAEQCAITHGFGKLFTEASELALPAFTRAGYRLLHRRDFSLGSADKSVPIHNYAMEKPIK